MRLSCCLTIALAAAASACATTVGADAANFDGDNDASGESSVPSDGRVDDAIGDASGPPTSSGYIQLLVSITTDGGLTSAIATTFVSGTSGMLGIPTGTSDCRIPGTAADAGEDAGIQDAGAVLPESAGAIVVHGRTNPDISLTPTAMVYPYVTRTGAYWTDDEMIDVSATGGQIPAFSTSFVFPGRVSWLSPTTDPSTHAVEIDHTQPLNLRWGPRRGLLVVSVGDLLGGEAALCAVDSMLGSVIIPPALLLDLFNAPRVGASRLDVTAVTVQTIRVQDAEVSVAGIAQTVTAPAHIY